MPCVCDALAAILVPTHLGHSWNLPSPDTCPSLPASTAIALQTPLPTHTPVHAGAPRPSARPFALDAAATTDLSASTSTSTSLPPITTLSLNHADAMCYQIARAGLAAFALSIDLAPAVDLDVLS